MSPKAIAIFDIDGVIRDVGGSYRRALADTVEHFTQGKYRPTSQDIDQLKSEGTWNNDWEGSQELIYRYFEQVGRPRADVQITFEAIVDFFQRQYRGPNLTDSTQWTGYIAHEPLLVGQAYFAALTQAQIVWGFVSGATRGSAAFVLEQRLGLNSPALIAMEDAPGKPEPTGLLNMATQLSKGTPVPILYAGDTVADMQTVQRATEKQPHNVWIGVGILPPHVVAAGQDYAQQYRQRLLDAGAQVVLPQVANLTAAKIDALID